MDDMKPNDMPPTRAAWTRVVTARDSIIFDKRDCTLKVKTDQANTGQTVNQSYPRVIEMINMLTTSLVVLGLGVVHAATVWPQPAHEVYDTTSSVLLSSSFKFVDGSSSKSGNAILKEGMARVR